MKYIFSCLYWSQRFRTGSQCIQSESFPRIGGVRNADLLHPYFETMYNAVRRILSNNFGRSNFAQNWTKMSTACGSQRRNPAAVSGLYVLPQISVCLGVLAKYQVITLTQSLSRLGEFLPRG